MIVDVFAILGFFYYPTSSYAIHLLHPHSRNPDSTNEFLQF